MTSNIQPHGGAVNQPQARYILPSFIEHSSFGIKESNPYNKLFEERIIFLGVQVDDASANDVMAPGFCVSRPEYGMPCTTGANRHKAARSRHPGGVNIMLGDGSVRYIRNSISLTVFQALGTMNGGESINAANL